MKQLFKDEYLRRFIGKMLLTIVITMVIAIAISSTVALHEVEKVIMENHLEEYFYGPNWNDQMIEAE
jgi:hypothetical protein